jgi:HEPN domain-containing protein
MNLTAYLNDYAIRSFRNIADQDYIAARTCYRNELYYHFLWNSLQSIEKYLKAILLFNGKSAKGIGHNIVRALSLVRTVSDIQFNLPSDVENFIQYLNDYGSDRYLVQPFYLRDTALLDFDKSDWYVRRYCFYLRGEITTPDGRTISLFESEVKKIHRPDYEKNPHRFGIIGGYLETILSEKRPAMTNLIWNNFYFGRRKKHRIKNIPFRVVTINPTHFMYPEIYIELNRLVNFPSAIRKYFEP